MKLILIDNNYVVVQIKMNVQQHIMPQLQDLYQWLEGHFSPVQLCCRVSRVLDFLQENEELELHQYVKPLQNVAIVRLLKQVKFLQGGSLLSESSQYSLSN